MGVKEKKLLGHEVLNWEEYKAFVKRLGVTETGRTVAICISIIVGGVVMIDHEYIGEDGSIEVE